MDLISYILSKKTVQNLKDSLGDAAYLNAPAEGRDAADDEVVLGRDSRLSGTRPHTHTLSDITDAGTAAAYNIPLIGDATNDEVVMGDDSRLTNSRDPNPHTHLKTDITDFAHTHTLSDISDVPENSGAEYSVSIMGDAGDNELVLGDDSRLSDNRDPNPHVHSLLDITDAGTSAALDYSNIVTTGDDTHLVTSKAVADAIANLPEPMVFRGSLGVGGTISDLPIDGTAIKGDTYKVITDGIYAGYPAKVGDTFVCDSKTISSNTWTYIPSGDEPSGTVISVGVSAGNNGIIVGTNVGNNDPITESGVISVSHADTSSQASTDNSGRTYIQNITLDDYGHITNLSSATETVVDTNTTYTFGSGDNNGEIKVTPSEGSSYNVSVTGLGPAAFEATEKDILDKITSSQITTALGYIPYNSTNPNGYTSNIGTVTQVKIGNTEYNPVSGIISLPNYPTVPTKLSQFTNDLNILNAENDTANGATYSAQTEYSSVKFALVRRKTSGVNIDTSDYGGGLLSIKWPSGGNYNSELFMGMGDKAELYHRGYNGQTATYSDWKKIAFTNDIPTKVSQLTNDSGYTTNTGTVTSVKVGSTSYSPSSGVVSLPAYPDISTKVSKSGDTMTGTLNIGNGTNDTPLYVKGNSSESYIGFKNANGDTTFGFYGVKSDNLPYFYSGSLKRIALLSEVPTKTSQLTNDSGFLTSLTKAQVTTALGYTPSTSSHTHSNIVTAGDNRGVATTPNDYANKIIFQGLKTNSKIGSPSTDTYSYLIGLRGWQDSSGGNSWELAFNNTGINVRNGATTSWGNWQTLITSGNISSQSVKYATSAGSATSATSAASATKATQDGNGNTISSTYLKKSGDTMTGTLTSRSIEPSSDAIYSLGASSKRFNVGWLRALYSDTVTCGRTGVGGKSTQGILEFYPYNHTNDNRVQFMVDSDATLTTIYTVLIRAKSGTLALTSDIPSVPSQAETARRSRFTMSTKGAWTTASYGSALPSSYGHAIILIYYTINGITCLMSETRVTKAEWEACASPNIMMPFVSSPPNDAYGVYLQYVSTSQFKYYVGPSLAGDWSVVIKTTVV